MGTFTLVRNGLITAAAAGAVLVGGEPAAAQAAPRPQALAGKWELFLPGDRKYSARLVELRAQGAKLSGTYTTRQGKRLELRPVKLAGRTLSLTAPDAGLEVSMQYKKGAKGDYFEGQVLRGIPGQDGKPEPVRMERRKG